MSNPLSDTVQENKRISDASFEKVHDLKGETSSVSIGSDEARDAANLKEVEELEDRLANDDADEEEYRVQEAYEVALKVCSRMSTTTHTGRS